MPLQIPKPFQSSLLVSCGTSELKSNSSITSLLNRKMYDEAFVLALRGKTQEDELNFIKIISKL